MFKIRSKHCTYLLNSKRNYTGFKALYLLWNVQGDTPPPPKKKKKKKMRPMNMLIKTLIFRL